MGWFWFLVMLVPVIGIVQVGMQAIADRYTYLPSIGLFIALAWGMADMAAASRRWRMSVIIGAIFVLFACLVMTQIQLRYWKDDITLFGRSVEINPENNFQGYNLLANAYRKSGDWDEAANCYRAMLRMAPASADTRRDLTGL